MIRNANEADGSQTSPVSGPVQAVTSRRESRVLDLMAERSGAFPQWVRSPKTGPEYFSGFGRSKLYELAGNGLIRSVSIREPGQIKGTRLFYLPSILAYIEQCEARANEGGAN